MLKEEFLNKIKNEVENSSNKWLKEIYNGFELSLKACSLDFNIDETKTASDCFAKMKDYADEHQEDGCYAFTIQETESFIKNYLGVQEIKKINLEDFI